jgi:hypothetical protein
MASNLMMWNPMNYSLAQLKETIKNYPKQVKI